MQNVIMAKKLEVYTELINIFTDFADPKVQRQVKQNPKKQEELGRKMTTIGIQISLLGSPKVVKKYVQWRLLTQGGGEPDAIVDCFSDIILVMREDLIEGASVGVTSDDILGSFLTMDNSELKD